MSVTEAAQFRQRLDRLERALVRSEMDRRALEHRVKQLEAAVGDEQPALVGGTRTAAA